MILFDEFKLTVALYLHFGILLLGKILIKIFTITCKRECLVVSKRNSARCETSKLETSKLNKSRDLTMRELL